MGTESIVKKEKSTLIVKKKIAFSELEVGRIIRYVVPEDLVSQFGRNILPATIVNINYESKPVTINIKVHTNAPHDVWLIDIPFSAKKESNTWHWPKGSIQMNNRKSDIKS